MADQKKKKKSGKSAENPTGTPDEGKKQEKISLQTAKESLFQNLSEEFSLFIKSKNVSFESLLKHEDLFNEFISDLESRESSDLLSKLTAVYGNDIKWEAIKDWSMNGMETMENILRYSIEDKMSKDIGKSLANAFSKKYISFINQAIADGVFAGFTADQIRDLKQALPTISSDDIKSLYDNIKNLKTTFNIDFTKIHGFESYEEEHFVVTNQDVLNQIDLLNDGNALSKNFSKNYDSSELLTKALSKSKTSIKTLVKSLTKIQSINVLSKDLEILSTNVTAVSRFFDIPGLGSLLSGYKFGQSEVNNTLNEINSNASYASLSQDKKLLLVYARLIKYSDISNGISDNLGDLLERLIFEGKLENNDKKIFIEILIDRKFNHSKVDENLKLLGIDLGNDTQKQKIAAALGLTDPNFDPKAHLKEFFNNLYSQDHNQINIKMSDDLDFTINFQKKQTTVNAQDANSIIDSINIGYDFDWNIGVDDLKNKKDLYFVYFRDYFTQFGSQPQEDKKLILPTGLDKPCKLTVQGSTTSAGLDGKIGVFKDKLYLHYNDGTNDVSKEFDVNEIEVIDSKTFKVEGVTYIFESFVTNFNQSDLSRLAYMKVGSLAYLALDENQKQDYQRQYFDKVLEENFSDKRARVDSENSVLNNKLSDKENQIQEFNKSWTNIEGERAVDFKVGSQMFLRLSDSFLKVGGGSMWVRAEITKVTENDFSFKIYGSEFDLIGEKNNYEGKEITIPKNNEVLLELLSAFSHSVLKFNKINNLTEFDKTLKSIDVSDYKKIKTGKDLWANMSLKGDHFENSNNEKIEYVGAQFISYENDKPEKHFDGFKLAFKDDGVMVESHGTKGFKRFMDYNTFFVFVTEKQLQPMTELEFKQNEILLDDMKKKEQPETPSLWVSFANVMHTYKSLKDGLNHKLKRVDDLRAAKFQRKLVGGMAFKAVGGVASFFTLGLLREPFDDLQIESLSELDAQVWKIIKDYKDKLSREGAVHAGRLAEIIYKDIFLEPEIYKTNPLKAAGYLLYALESGGGPYFRALKKDAGKGKWTLAVLGPVHQRKFLNLLSVKQKELEKKPNDENLLDEIMRLEIWYIKDVLGEDAYKNEFGAKFGVEVEVAFTNGHGKQKAVDVENDEIKKSSFSEIYGAYKGYMGALRAQNTLGALGALTKKFESDQEYTKWTGAMLMPILSGIALNDWDKVSKKLYRGMARANGFSMGLYILDAKGPEKILRILDYASKKVGLDGKNLFSSSIGLPLRDGKYDTSSISPSKYGANFEKIIENFEKWWEQNGAKVLPYVNLENIGSGDNMMVDLEMFNNTNLPANKKIDSETYKTLKDYVDNKIFEVSTETYANNNDYYSEGGPHYPRVMMNLSSGFIENVMYSALNSRDANKANYMWKVLRDKVNQFSSNKYLDKTSFEFIGKKFVTWTKHKFGGDFMSIVSYMYAAKQYKNKGNLSKAKNMLNLAISSHFNGYNANPYVIETFDAFENLFLNNMDKIDENYIKETFGPDAVNYFNADAFRGNKVNTGSKQEVKMNKQMAQVDFAKEIQGEDIQEPNYNNPYNNPYINQYNNPFNNLNDEEEIYGRAA